MKILFIACFFLALVGCGKTGEHAGHGQESSNTENPNQALYSEVMDIHDEVMPKMEDLYTYKQKLEEKIATTPDMSAEQKTEIESMIMSLDSASKSMMNWMHEFKPLSDSTDQEAAREYLESEMESIKKVRDITNETLEKAKTVSEKK